MDIMELKKRPHLSASGIKDYAECSLKYRFSRVDKLKPEGTSDALELGSCIHKALADFHQERMIGNKLSIQELHESFEGHWKSVIEVKHDIKYKKGNGFDTLLQDGKNLLTTYYDNLPDEKFTVLALEEPFSFNIPDLPIPIIGVFDMIEQDESGTIIIVDFKTSSKSYSSSDVDQSQQLTIYQMGLKQNGYRDREILLRFDCLIKTKVPKFEQYYTTRSEIDEKRLAKKIYCIFSAIEKNIFLPNESWKCGGCSFRRHCDEWFLKTD